MNGIELYLELLRKKFANFLLISISFLFFTFEILTNRRNPINLLREKKKKLLNTTRNNEVKLEMRGQLPFSSDD